MKPLVIRNVFQLARDADLAGVLLPIQVPQSVATALALFCSRPFSEASAEAMNEAAHLGVDMLRLSAGESFPLHTHPGHHLLLILRGRGSVTYDGRLYPTEPGDLYIMDGGVEHAVGALDDHYLLAFGAPHVEPDDPARMSLVPATPPAPLTYSSGSAAATISEQTTVALEEPDPPVYAPV